MFPRRRHLREPHATDAGIGPASELGALADHPWVPASLPVTITTALCGFHARDNEIGAGIKREDRRRGATGRVLFQLGGSLIRVGFGQELRYLWSPMDDQ